MTPSAGSPFSTFLYQLIVHSIPVFNRIVGSRRAIEKALFDLAPGVTEVYLHPSIDTDELRASHPDWPNRVEDHAMLTRDPAFADLVERADAHAVFVLASGTLARHRFLLLLFGIFAGLALLLACIGIYGVLAYLTSQRVPEFGVRIALGASAHDVMRLVLRQSLGMIFAGVGVGIFAALAAGRLLVHLVNGMRPTEPSTFAIMIPILVFAALLASFAPAHRASRIDPMSALRQE